MKKILNILLGVILLITVILTVYAMVAGGSNEAILPYLGVEKIQEEE